MTDTGVTAELPTRFAAGRPSVGTVATNGYQISPAAVNTQAAATREMAGELFNVQERWLAATAGAASALGIAELVTAFGTMRTTVCNEFDEYVGIAFALSDKLASAAIGYSDKDKDAATGYQQVGP